MEEADHGKQESWHVTKRLKKMAYKEYKLGEDQGARHGKGEV